MNFGTPKILSILLAIVFLPYLSAQSAWERSVLLSATVQENPTQIHLSWPADPNATDYQVYRKSLEATDWGDALASLAGDAVAFTDNDVEVGKLYEYALFKKNFDTVVQTFCIDSGSNLEFAVNDMYGIGLCCNFGFGYYSVMACGEEVAYGDNFGFSDTTFFSICDQGNACEEVSITLLPDMFPNSTSWTLRDTDTGELLATSGPVGTHLAERPKYGFISAGIKVSPVVQSRGSILLLVAEPLAAPLQAEIEQLELDLLKDHWRVITKSVAESQAVTAVRALIQQCYQNTPDLKALYLLGHIPVPYSGDIYPDTHSENHQGAWSADTYYAELNGNWTDEVANITTAFFERNHNVPGDGKFDQDSIPSQVELQVGRVDLSNLPSFGLGEVELTRRYLQKAHAYKTGKIVAERRALIDDNFGQAFAGPTASGWRNFAPMFGAANIVELDYFSTMREESYLWSYGCGGGSHISAGGIGSTANFAQDSLQSVFTMLFGSQFGDWDNVDNFLRAPLASGTTLTNAWAGSPPWTFHQMAMGYPIGYCALRSMNSTDGVYLNGPQLVHMALLGDPSLRMFMIPPLEDNGLEIEMRSSDLKLVWNSAATADLAGYLVYRAAGIREEFTLLHQEIISDTFFVDAQPLAGENVYQVKVVKLEESASGTYYNQSLGIIDSAYFSPVVSVKNPPEEMGLIASPNPTQEGIQLSWPEKFSSEQELQLFNIQGNRMDAFRIKPEQKNFYLDTAHLEPGTYILTLGKWVYRMVKL